MKIQEIKIKGITYTVRAKTNAGIKSAIKMLKTVTKNKED